MSMQSPRYRRSRLAGVAVLAVGLIGLSVSGSSRPAEAIEVLPLQPVYSDTVYGSVFSVGNGNMRCPIETDGVNLRAGTSYEACAQAQLGSVPAGVFTNNNEYSMRWNNTDGRSDTFNNSSATIDIPEGATIRYAMLEWAGHTGEFRGGGGVTSSISSCNIIGQQYVSQFPTTFPAAPAAATPEEQSPGIQINGSEPYWVTPNVTRDSSSAWPNNSDRMYTGWADVTDILDTADLSGTSTVTVSNIWAPSGVNCTAGWGLTVVWAFDELVPGVAEYQNSINIFQGHVRQGSADLPSTVTFSGFEAASSNNRIGLVAYEGDRGTVGDRFSINGTDVAEPTGYGTINDFFVSSADGASNPSWRVNFSADVNNFTTDLIQAGDTEATLGFRTSGDGYWLQSLWLEAPIASVSITKTANIEMGRPGDPVVWTITVQNPTPAEIHDVVVTDPQEPACNRTMPTPLNFSASYTYTCEGVLPDQTVTNTATVTALTETGKELTDQDSATVEVIHPEIKITKSADRDLYLDGETVNFTIVVENSGDTDLVDTVVSDPKVPDCSATLGTLQPGEKRTITCTATAPIVGNENTATVTASDPLLEEVRDDSSALTTIAEPSITIDKKVSQAKAHLGDTVTFNITVTNTGNVTLNNVTLDDPRLTTCSEDIGTMLPGEVKSTTCTWKADELGEFTNTAVAEGVAMRCTGDEAAGTCSEELGVPKLSVDDSATVEVSAKPVGPAPGGDGGNSSSLLNRTGGPLLGGTIAIALLLVATGVLLTARRQSQNSN